jgi:O-antigen ligase
MQYLIALIVLLLPTYLIRFSVFGIPLTVLEILIYVVFIYGLFNLGYTHLLKNKKRVWLPIGLLLLAVLISVYISPEKEVALGQLKAYFIDPLLVFWLIICFLKKEDICIIFSGLIGSGTLVSLYSIFQKILGNITSDNRVIGIFGYSPNYVALFLVPIIILILSIIISNFDKKKLENAVILGIVALINIYALYLSGSRGGELAVLGGTIVFLMLHYRDKINKKPILKISIYLVLLLAIIGAIWFFRPNFDTISGRVASSNNVRWQIWTESVNLVAKHPVLGIGLGNFQNSFADSTKNIANFPEYITPEALTPHNIFLMFYITTGLLGIIAFAWLIYIFYKTGFKSLDKKSIILIAVMTGILLHGLVDAAYFKNDLSLIFWVILGLMVVGKE